MPIAPRRLDIPPSPDPAPPQEVTLRQIQRATGKNYSALGSRARREGWPSRADSRLDDGNRASNRRLYRIADLPADIRSTLESKRARRQPPPAPLPSPPPPPRRRREFLDLGI